MSAARWPLRGMRRAGSRALDAAARLGRSRLSNVAKRRLVADVLGYPLWQLPGHYYSPLPDIDAAMAAAKRAETGDSEPLDVDLREDAQLDLLRALVPMSGDVAFPPQPAAGWRFHHENSQFPYGDAILLHLLLRHWRPRHVVEVGSGHSTALMIDTVERRFDAPVAITCVEPHPERLRSVVGEFPEYMTLIDTPVQDAPTSVFDDLAAGDVLFIDSTHVAKTGSDVVYELFELLPRLAPGVYVHFHDICWPFEYPPRWVSQGRAWNEVYLVHAFLANNEAFEITLFNHMMLTRHQQWFAEHLPGCLQRRERVVDDVTGHGLWLRKRTDRESGPAT